MGRLHPALYSTGQNTEQFNSIQFFINLEQYNSSDQSTFTYTGKSNIEIDNSGWTWVVIIVKLIISHVSDDLVPIIN